MRRIAAAHYEDLSPGLDNAALLAKFAIVLQTKLSHATRLVQPSSVLFRATAAEAGGLAPGRTAAALLLVAKPICCTSFNDPCNVDIGMQNCSFSGGLEPGGPATALGSPQGARECRQHGLQAADQGRWEGGKYATMRGAGLINSRVSSALGTSFRQTTRAGFCLMLDA